MALPKRSTQTQNQTASTQNLKQRVITCLNKLSDRDTQTIATAELESIARNLSHESFLPFLNCIYDTDSSEKTPVRKQCVKILGFLSETHGDSLNPFVNKMVLNIIKRLRDSDTAVRLACVDSISAMVNQIENVPFTSFTKPLMEAIQFEQDYSIQIGAALCLSSVIEGSNDPELVQLRRVLPKLIKLLKSDSFKAKPALITLIGSIIGVGGIVSNVLENLIPCLIEFLSNEDWNTRKAAAETFSKLGVKEKDILVEFKSPCLNAFESRRFDKVKVVRDRMNEMIEVWKDIPECVNEISSPSLSKSSSSTENFSSRSSSTITTDESHRGSRKKSSPISKSPPRDSPSTTTTTARKKSNNDVKSSPVLFRKLDFNNKMVDDQNASSTEEELSEINLGSRELIEEKIIGCLKVQNKRVPLSNKSGMDKAGSRVFAVQEEDNSESKASVSCVTKELDDNEKDNEEILLIRKQLLHIENQQSNLFDILQRFIGSSRNGIKSLETRVLGLEMALDGISYDLAMSSRRVPDGECWSGRFGIQSPLFQDDYRRYEE
ncbi:hypothetical protein C5167_006369 [Papaver somniferum]|uniref:TORTIFOLIA1/SINE1-2 N-terminal domain-containing protein n=1 Tax=Papaver somniferum TaxID=3469 RepID=A0A4Y7JGC2_PAPSO|nr:TORTIFOLIA1-like protein 4 [Papaver somniferum]RZC59070.1 hypothetical protein C5167_006369 [Papaver somniferum]